MIVKKMNKFCVKLRKHLIELLIIYHLEGKETIRDRLGGGGGPQNVSGGANIHVPV